LYLSCGFGLLLKNRKRESRKMALRSLSYTPTIRVFVLILLTFLGHSIIQFLRHSKRGLLGAEK
jgi:hypothetical protein